MLISSYSEVLESKWEEQIIKEAIPNNKTENALNSNNFKLFPTWFRQAAKS